MLIAMASAMLNSNQYWMTDMMSTNAKIFRKLLTVKPHKLLITDQSDLGSRI